MPIAWAILLLFHPGGDGTNIYEDLHDKVTAWMTVHLGMLVFIPLMASAVYVLLRGVAGTAARVSRIALVPFVIFYGAFEITQGIAVGALVDELNGRSGMGRAMRADLVQDFAESILFRDFGIFSTIGTLGLITAMIAAGLALRRCAGAPLPVGVLLGLSGLLIGAHPPPFGPIGLAIFVIAVLLFLRSQSTSPVSTAGGTQAGPEPHR